MFTKFIHYHFRDIDSARNSMCVLALGIATFGGVISFIATFLLR